jgi:hypothetical protein
MRGADMAYIVQAVFTGRDAGTYRCRSATRQAAFKSAKELRQAGMQTIVIGPNGTPIDETVEPLHSPMAKTENST